MSPSGGKANKIKERRVVRRNSCPRWTGRGPGQRDLIKVRPHWSSISPACSPSDSKPALHDIFHLRLDEQALVGDVSRDEPCPDVYFSQTTRADFPSFLKYLFKSLPVGGAPLIVSNGWKKRYWWNEPINIYNASRMLPFAGMQRFSMSLFTCTQSDPQFLTFPVVAKRERAIDC